MFSCLQWNLLCLLFPYRFRSFTLCSPLRLWLLFWMGVKWQNDKMDEDSFHLNICIWRIKRMQVMAYLPFYLLFWKSNKRFEIRIANQIVTSWVLRIKWNILWSMEMNCICSNLKFWWNSFQSFLIRTYNNVCYVCRHWCEYVSGSTNIR